jgi:hypothetical protein
MVQISITRRADIAYSVVSTEIWLGHFQDAGCVMNAVWLIQ